MRPLVRLQPAGTSKLDLRHVDHYRQRISYEWNGGEARIGTLYSPALVQLLGPARGDGETVASRHQDVARSVQAMYEEAFLHLLTCLHDRYRVSALALAGGCAM